MKHQTGGSERETPSLLKHFAIDGRFNRLGVSRSL
jgi:hypothetical protein